MATMAYCTNISAELAAWSKKLHDISEKFAAIPSIEKYKLTPQIEGLHILITELDDRIKALRTDCSNVEVAAAESGVGYEKSRQQMQ